MQTNVDGNVTFVLYTKDGEALNALVEDLREWHWSTLAIASATYY